MLFLLIFSPVSHAATKLTISNTPTSTNEENLFTFDFQLSQSTSAKKTIYLRAVLFREGTTQYFGYTKNQNDEWINSSSDKSKFLEITVSAEGSASGQINAKADLSSNNFKGAGEYRLKLGRYTSASDSSAEWSNEAIINISAPASPSPDPSPTPNPTQKSSSTPTPTPTPDSTLESTNYQLTTEDAGDIAGVSDSTEINLTTFTLNPSPSPEPEEEEEKKSKTPLALAGAGLTFASAGGAYFYQQKKKKPKINIPGGV